jgi:hypothetical protein
MSAGESPREDEAHDVLAAEAFAVPAPDPSLRHEPITLPDDPSGIAEPHDVLAAEEFAMPAAPPGAHGPGGAPPSGVGLLPLLLFGWIVTAVVRRRRRRRQSR